MSADFYDCFDDVMKECLAEFDCRSPKIKLIRHSGRTMNSVTREMDAGTTAEIEVTGVTVPYNNNQIDGVTVQANDRRLVIDSQQEPQIDDDVLIDTENFAIIAIETYNPGGQKIGYSLQLRR